MKKTLKLLTLLLTFTFATSSFADNADNIALVAIGNPTINVIMPPGMASVQPRAAIQFTYRSCRKADFSLEKEDSLDAANTTLLKIKIKSLLDCFGISRKRTYSLQVTSDYSRQKYVVLNPIPTAVIRPQARN